MVLGGLLFCLALSFLFSARLTYFKEWKYDADVRDAYSVLSYFNHKFHVTHVASTWRYSSALNFYRAASRSADFAAFDGFIGACPPGEAIYVLNLPENEDCARANGLNVVYRGALSELGIAIQPKLMTPVQTGR
jgi:hypothetical protein